MRLSHLLASTLLCSLASLLTACGGGDTPAAAPASTTVSGDVVKGPVNGATVTFKRPDGSVIGTTTTDASGHYSLAIAYTGDVVIEASGGSYTDEASGSATPLATPLRAVLRANGGTVTGMVTPLTTLAYTYAFPSGTPASSSRFNTVAERLATQFNLAGVNLVSTLPVVSGSTNDYGKVLVAFSQFLQDNETSLAELIGAALQEADWAAFSSAFSSAYITANGGSYTMSFDGNGLTIDLGTGGGGTGSLTVSVSISGAPATSFTVNGVPAPTGSTDFCSDIESDESFQSIGASGGGTLTLNSCSFSGNVGTVSATLAITTPVALTVPYTVTYTYN